MSSPESSARPIHAERRSQWRSRIDLPLRWTTIPDQRSGNGTLRDISSAGLSFSSEEALEPGSPIEVTVNWFYGESGRRFQFIIQGHVLRSDDSGTAIQMRDYQICSVTTSSRGKRL